MRSYDIGLHKEIWGGGGLYRVTGSCRVKVYSCTVGKLGDDSEIPRF